MIESGRVATVHEFPLWRILVPDFWNPSRATHILQICPLQGCSWSLASLLIPLLSLLPGCSRPRSPCLLCAANPGHIQAAELWHWQSHQDQDAYQTSEGGWPPQAGCKVSNSGKRVAQQIPIWKALAYRWYLKPWIWGDYLQAIHSGDLHIMTFNSKKHKHQRSRVCIGNSGLLTSWSPC